MKKKPKHTDAGLGILSGLQEIADALESGKRLTGRIYSGPVTVAKPGRSDPTAIVGTSGSKRAAGSSDRQDC